MTEQNVKVKYAWSIRKRMILALLVHRSRFVIRPALKAWDWLFYDYKAEGHADLVLGEWLRIKRCEWSKKHLGVRETLGNVKYCSYCQCRWAKFDKRYNSEGFRIDKKLS